MSPLQANNVLQLWKWHEQINLDPPYQRLSVWDREKRQTFIDSVINGFDIPKLYFHEVSASSSPYRFTVIDGKQRLLAIWEFMANELPLARSFRFFDDESILAGDRTYSELISTAPRLRARFDDFEVPVTVVQTDDEYFIEDLFTRLNIQVSLSAPEARNALGGPLAFTIRQVGVHRFFTSSVRIINNRLQHFDLAAKFLYLTHVNRIASTKKATLDNFVREFKRLKDADPTSAKQTVDVLRRDVEEILEAMAEFFLRGEFLLQSQGRTLLYFHVFRIHRDRGQAIRLTRNMLEEFNESVGQARRKSQRRAEGDDEPLTNLEQLLVRFDREKQSLNDGGAMKRQYQQLSEYFSEVFRVGLAPED
jgi:hypothetical protein